LFFYLKHPIARRRDELKGDPLKDKEDLDKIKKWAFSSAKTSMSDVQRLVPVETMGSRMKELEKVVHIRSFPEGENIFEQDTPRRFMYLLIRGEACYSYSLPDWASQDSVLQGVLPHSLDLALHLFPGDFSMMETENADSWVSRRPMNINSGERMAEFTRRDLMTRVFPFEKHCLSLRALTKVEVVVIPLDDIGTNRNLFVLLMQAHNRRYDSWLANLPESFVSSYLCGVQWEADRRRIVNRQVNEHNFDRALPERHRVDVRSSYSDRLYHLKTKGSPSKPEPPIASRGGPRSFRAGKMTRSRHISDPDGPTDEKTSNNPSALDDDLSASQIPFNKENDIVRLMVNRFCELKRKREKKGRELVLAHPGLLAQQYQQSIKWRADSFLNS
jgi:CRP-like cAMP-binding protein